MRRGAIWGAFWGLAAGAAALAVGSLYVDYRVIEPPRAAGPDIPAGSGFRIGRAETAPSFPAVDDRFVSNRPQAPAAIAPGEAARRPGDPASQPRGAPPTPGLVASPALSDEPDLPSETVRLDDRPELERPSAIGSGPQADARPRTAGSGPAGLPDFSPRGLGSAMSDPASPEISSAEPAPFSMRSPDGLPAEARADAAPGRTSSSPVAMPSSDGAAGPGQPSAGQDADRRPETPLRSDDPIGRTESPPLVSLPGESGGD